MPSKMLPRVGGSTRTPHAPDPQWLAARPEPIIEPALPIIDPHHHLFERPGLRYLLDEYLADVRSGHNLRASVFVDCGHSYRKDGPVAMAPLGEVEYANAVADSMASDPVKICAGIVSSADLTLGPEVAAVLDAEIAIAPERFRGIRLSAVWDPDPSLSTGRFIVPQSLLLDPDFRAGFAMLAPRKLSFEAWIYHPQLDELTDLARAFPETTIILNHIGGLLAGYGAYAARREAEIARWKVSMAQLATCPNVVVKLGGLGTPSHLGFKFHQAPLPPSSETLAAAWRPYLDPCIDLFGPDRCMFESNFPPDRQSCGFPVLWNTFKRIAQGFSPAEKHAMFFGTAARIYRLSLD